MAHINRTVPVNQDYQQPTIPGSARPTTAAPPDNKPHVRAPESGTMRSKLGGAPGAAEKEAANKTRFRNERLAREKSQGPGAHSKQILAAIDNAKDNPDAKVMLFGYSPTGGGHTGRLLTILDQAIDYGNFNKGDIVVAHVPSIWNGRPRPKDLSDLLTKFSNKGVTVVLAQAEKSVQGYLRPDGSSNDPAILSRIANMPHRKPADITSIGQGKIYKGPADLENIESIDANHLFDSLDEHLGKDNMHKVYVADDMDPAMQKAAARYGVPDEQRMGQQNHAILLEASPDQMSENLKPGMGVLGKVLGGYGEQVAHIGLGDKNTLQQMAKTAASLGLTSATGKQEALQKMSALFLEHGAKVDVNNLPTSQSGAGIMHHPSLTDAGKVKNMMYVYANDNQAQIARHIDAQIKVGAPSFKDTLFVFCGKGAFKPGAPSYNALHMAYLADADGITTAGAGTVGEFGYLHKSGEARSKFMAIPIKGHNEQEANADFIAKDPHLRQFVTVASELEHNPLEGKIDRFMAQNHENIGQKYAGQKLEGMLKAVGNSDTYPAHGRKLLFGQEPMTAQEARFAEIERNMNQDTVLSANRHMQKVFFQAAESIIPQLEGTASAGPIAIKLRRGQEPQNFEDAGALARFLRTDGALTFLADGKQIRQSDVLLLDETRELFDKLGNMSLSSADSVKAINELKEKFGHQTTTGF